MKAAGGSSLAAQERDALADPEHKKAAREYAKAAGAFETLKTLANAAETRIEMWRTMSANARRGG